MYKKNAQPSHETKFVSDEKILYFVELCIAALLLSYLSNKNIELHASMIFLKSLF